MAAERLRNFVHNDWASTKTAVVLREGASVCLFDALMVLTSLILSNLLEDKFQLALQLLRKKKCVRYKCSTPTFEYLWLFEFVRKELVFPFIKDIKVLLIYLISTSLLLVSIGQEKNERRGELREKEKGWGRWCCSLSLSRADEDGQTDKVFKWVTRENLSSLSFYK